MTTKYITVIAAVVALALTSLLIGPIVPKVASLPASAPGQITNFRVSDSCAGPKVDVFPADTKTVYVVFDYIDMQGEEIRVTVSDPLGALLYDRTDSYTGSGTECIPVSSDATAFAPGKYAANMYSGEYPAALEVWHVRSPGPGQITNFRMSDSPFGPAVTEFLAGITTVYVVFDYADMQGAEIGVEVCKDHYCWFNRSEPYTGSGTKSIPVPSVYVGGFPPGSYASTISRGGFVDHTSDWSVRYRTIYLPLILKNY